MCLSRFIFLDKINTRLFVLLLMLMFVDYAGYGYYFFFLPFLYLFTKDYSSLVDKYFLLIFFWGSIYGLTYTFNTGNLGYASLGITMINCPILYLCGKYLTKYNSIQSIPNILFLFVSSIALISIISVLIDINAKGFLVDAVGRNIPLIGSSSVNVAATGISSRLLPLAVFFSLLLLPSLGRNKIVVLFLALLAIFCGLRIQSRTLVICVSLCMFLTATWNFSSIGLKQKILLLMGILFLVIITTYIVFNYGSELAILERFQSDEFETGGGRTYRLMEVASNIPNYPLGNMPSKIPFAHNLWFDCARTAGILPFILLIAISFSYAKTFVMVIKHLKCYVVLKNILFFLSFTLVLVCLSEPILEGIPMIFEFFCLLFGVIVQLKNEFYIRNLYKQTSLL